MITFLQYFEIIVFSQRLHPTVVGLVTKRRVFEILEQGDHVICAVSGKPIMLEEYEIESIEQFLISLTGKSKNNRPLGRPAKVPSQLSVD